MASIDRYIRKAKQEFKVRPALPFGVSVDVGVVGVVEDGQFVRHGTAGSILQIADLGAVVSQESESNWQIESGRDVGVKFLAAGQAAKAFPQVPSVGVRIEVSFKREDSFLAVVRHPTTYTLSDPQQLIQAMLEAYRNGVWLKEYVVVYEVVRSKSTLVLLAKESGTELLLSTDVDIDPAGQPLADVAANLSVTAQSKQTVRFDSDGDLAVFFNAYRVKPGFWTGRIKVQAFGANDDSTFFEKV